MARRSIYAARPIEAGEPFTEDNLSLLRPGGVAAPVDFWRTLGECASRNYAPHERIQEPGARS